MKRAIFLLTCVLSGASQADWSGNIALQSTNFLDDALYSGQLNNDLSVSTDQKFDRAWNNGDDVFTAEFFARTGSKDEEKNHVNFPVFKWLHLAGDYEWHVGVDTVFWGVTESQNLVDVINQKDAVEGSDNEHKLGQPMLHLTAVKDWGVIDSYLLLGFIDRTFPGVEGRPRTPLTVAANHALYESSDEDNHIDYAIRYSHYYEDIDYAFSFFKGTQRDPLLNLAMINGESVLQPYYPQITQWGVELQTIVEAWLWKFEAIYVDTKAHDQYSAATSGFEYTYYGVFDSAIDVGTIVEYLHDSRGSKATTPFNQDLFLGVRLTFNDIQSTSVLAGLIYDTDNNTRIMSIEGERRLGEDWTLKGEIQLYSDIDSNDTFYAFRNDNALQIELAFNF